PSLLAAADGVVGACDDDGVAATVERLLELPTD
ncbi:MAG: haloacid dehalogenase, partial [Micrococcus luteus]